MAGSLTSNFPKTLAAELFLSKSAPLFRAAPPLSKTCRAQEKVLQRLLHAKEMRVQRGSVNAKWIGKLRYNDELTAAKWALNSG
jgi:hypothetical protein